MEEKSEIYKLATAQKFSEAISLYCHRNLHDAQNFFQECLDVIQGDEAARIYVGGVNNFWKSDTMKFGMTQEHKWWLND